MTRKAPSRAATTLLTLLLSLTPLACGGEDDATICTGGACVIRCQDPGCTPACNKHESCDVTCGDRCDFECSDGTNCEASCGDDCSLLCGSVGTCTTTCDARCAYTCQDASNCAPTLGPDSAALCLRVGNCNVQCQGDCAVRCEQTGNCNVNCAHNDRLTCPDGRIACGRCDLPEAPRP
jgi:hypothetical protein